MRFLGVYSIGNFSDFQSSYKVNDIPQVSVEEVKKQQSNVIPENPIPESVENQVPDNRPKIANLEELSYTFNKQEDFSYLGSDKDIELLDMRKAISDMKQDSAFREYQYFVGSSSNVFESADGKVIAK